MSHNNRTTDDGRQPLGVRIRRARERAGLTLGELASQAGVSERTLRNWEQGAVNPTKLGRIEVILGVDLRDDADDYRDRRRSIREFSDGELIAEMARRYTERDRTIQELREQLAQARHSPANPPIPLRFVARSRGNGNGNDEETR